MIAVNTPDQAVTWGRSRAGNLTVLNVGSRDQRVLNRPGDDLRIDWGYFHLAVPDESGRPMPSLASRPRRSHSFVTNGKLPAADDLDMPRMPRDGAAHLAVAAAAWASRPGARQPPCAAGLYRGLRDRVSRPQAAPLLAAQRADRAGHADGGRERIPFPGAARQTLR